MTPHDDDLIHSIRSAAMALDDAPRDFSALDMSALIKDLADKYFVLLGEATHGTQEFYQARVEITKRLIIDHGVTAIAIEGDWPSAARVNRYVRGQGVDAKPMKHWQISPVFPCGCGATPSFWILLSG